MSSPPPVVFVERDFSWRRAVVVVLVALAGELVVGIAWRAAGWPGRPAAMTFPAMLAVSFMPPSSTRSTAVILRRLPFSTAIAAVTALLIWAISAA
jgi:hypothetical protein